MVLLPNNVSLTGRDPVLIEEPLPHQSISLKRIDAYKNDHHAHLVLLLAINTRYSTSTS